MLMLRDILDTVPDDDLLVLYGNGDGRAAQALAARHLPRVFRHARRVLGDAALAEDVAQEAMMRLWRVAGEWRPGEAKVSTWLYRVTANLCTDHLRRRRTVGLDEATEVPDPAAGAETRMQWDARADALQEALDRLPERQRQAVVLRHIEGLSNPEIGAVMNLGTRAVESLTARGKRALRAALVERKAELGFDNDR
jgi:RNA polymerase sigma-70 factor (ECF subfamily)